MRHVTAWPGLRRQTFDNTHYGTGMSDNSLPMMGRAGDATAIPEAVELVMDWLGEEKEKG